MALIILYLYLNIYLGRFDHFVVIYSARYFRFGTSNNLKKNWTIVLVRTCVPPPQP